MASETDIANVVEILEAAFPNFHPTERTVEVYHQVLNDIPAELLQAATIQGISEAGRKFAPSAGELRGLVGEIQKSIVGVPTSYDAWQEVCRVIVEVGSYGRPEFSSPLITKCVDLLGWRNLCLSENQVSDRMRFIEAYEQLEGRAERDALMVPQVRGYIEGKGGRLLGTGDAIGRLANKMRVPALVHPDTGERLE